MSSRRLRIWASTAPAEWNTEASTRAIPSRSTKSTSDAHRNRPSGSVIEKARRFLLRAFSHFQNSDNDDTKNPLDLNPAVDAGRGAASAGRADRTGLRTHGLRTGRRGFRCGRLLRRRGRRGRGNRRRIVRRGCRPRDGPRNPGRRRAGASCEDALRRDRRNDRSEPLDRRTDRGEKNRRFGHRRRLGTLCDPAGRASGPRRAQSAGHRRQRPPRHGLRIAFGVARHRRKPVVLVVRRPRAAPQSADAARRGISHRKAPR